MCQKGNELSISVLPQKPPPAIGFYSTPDSMKFLYYDSYQLRIRSDNRTFQRKLDEWVTRTRNSRNTYNRNITVTRKKVIYSVRLMHHPTSQPTHQITVFRLSSFIPGGIVDRVAELELWGLPPEKYSNKIFFEMYTKLLQTPPTATDWEIVAIYGKESVLICT